jgi:hypothetical protein
MSARRDSRVSLVIGHLVSFIGDWSLGQYLSFAALNLFGYNVRAMILLPIVQAVLRMTVVVERVREFFFCI